MSSYSTCGWRAAVAATFSALAPPVACASSWCGTRKPAALACRAPQGKRKQPGDQLFDTFDATDLNKELKNIMEGLSVKVGRGGAAGSVPDALAGALSHWFVSLLYAHQL